MENTQNNYGVPVNTKSLLAFIFNQMSRLNAGEIDWQTANAQAKVPVLPLSEREKKIVERLSKGE